MYMGGMVIGYIILGFGAGKLPGMEKIENTHTNTKHGCGNEGGGGNEAVQNIKCRL